jgi:hypothetical protein
MSYCDSSNSDSRAVLFVSEGEFAPIIDL